MERTKVHTTYCIRTYHVLFNNPKSITLHSRAANQGHAGAMNQLAWIYREGLGVNEDLDYAVVWHRYSAEANYPRAMTNLAYLYSIGKGVEKDLETSARWYKRAAELNSASGIYAVAVYYLNGTGGMPKNEF